MDQPSPVTKDPDQEGAEQAGCFPYLFFVQKITGWIGRKTTTLIKAVYAE